MSPVETWAACAALALAGFLLYAAGYAHHQRDQRAVHDYYRNRVAGLQQQLERAVKNGARLRAERNELAEILLQRQGDDFALWTAELGRKDAS